MKRFVTYIGVILAMAVPYGVAVAAAPAKSDPGSGKTIVANVNDPGDGGGAYPHYTGACGVGWPYTTYSYGYVGYFYPPPYHSGDGRDHCHGDGFMYREIFNGSDWNTWITRYD